MTSADAFCAGAAVGALATAAVAWAYVRRLTRRLGRFFSLAMHEINTPVTAINMTTLNLLSEVFGAVPDALKPWLEMSREQVARLSALVATARDFAHMELHDDLCVATQEQSAQALLERALGGVRLGMRQAEIELAVQSEPGLPAVRTDFDRAARCLTDVLFHARKFRTAGPISLTARRAARGVEFVLEYSGSPLAAWESVKCLELYYPARLRNDHTLSATGLGLGMTRSLARRIGGDLDFMVTDDGRATLILSFAAAAEAS
mgnify:FL=1